MSTCLLDVTLALEFNVTVIKLFKKQMQLFDC